jgi:hypothetical protein
MSSVKHDVFPALVALVPADDPVELAVVSSSPIFPSTARQVNTARVVVMDDLIIIAIDGGGAGPKIVFREAIKPETFIKNQGSDSFVETVSGKKVAYKKDNACGCGSRLRTWRPYNNVNSSKDPTE